jgi:signal transduction histidine kinase
MWGDVVRVTPRTLRARLVVLYTVGTSLVLLLCLSLLYVALDQRFRSALDADLDSRANDLTASVRAGDLAVVAADPLAQLYDADGNVEAASPVLAGRRLLTPAQVRAVGGPVTESRTVPLGPDGAVVDVRLLARRLDAGGQVLVVAVGSGAVDRLSADLFTVLAVAAPLLIAALAAAGWLVVRAALRPVDVLTREAAEISSLESGRRLPPVAGDDEIARLAATLDGMLGRLQVGFARERAFVDDASHELRTPVAVLRGEIDLALAALDEPAEVEQSLLAARGQVARLTRLAEDLLLLARERAGTLAVHREPVDLLALAKGEAGTLGPVVGLAVEVRGSPVVVEADADRLRQVLANLAANSAAAGAATARAGVSAAGGAAHLEWADDGPGFPPALLGPAFERFVRGDAARTSASGAGLGLSIVRAVVAAHGGTVEARNGPPLGGAVVTAHLPVD